MATIAGKKAKDGKMNPAPKKPDETTYSGRFAARLRMLREKTGMTGMEFSAAIRQEGYKLGQRTYFDWETGRTTPPLDAFPVLAKVLKMKSPRTLLPES